MFPIIVVLFGILLKKIASLAFPAAGPIIVTRVAGGSSFKQPSPQKHYLSKRKVSTLDWERHTAARFRAASLPSSQWVVTAIPYLTGVATTWLQDPTAYHALTTYIWKSCTR